MGYEAICNGPNKERADYYQLMADFYRLEEKDQLLFMAAFEHMVERAKKQKRPCSD